MDKQRWEESEKRREETRREERRSEKRKSQKKEDAGARKVEKSRFTVFFQWFVAPEGRKVGSLKRRVRSHLARWERKNCTPLWRQAHFEVKMYKAPQLRSTFGSWDVENVHTVVARSTCRSQNVQNTAKHLSVGPLLEVEMSKKWTPLRRKPHFEVKMYKKHTSFGPLLEVDMSKKCTPLWRKANFQVTPHAWTTFEGSDVVLRGRSKGLCTLLKMRNFVAFPKTMAGVGHLERICKDAFRVAGAVQETCSLEMLGLLGGPGADFLREVAFWSIRSSVLGRWNFVWQVQHFVWPGITFRGRRNTLETWTGTIAKRIGTRPQLCTQLSIFEGSLAELLPFWCCQLSQIEEVLQNSFVFQLADR